MKVWKDVKLTRHALGVTIWLQGGELRIGRRLYRWRWFTN